MRTIRMITGVLVLTGAAFAQMPGRHPHYLSALSDLRTARWLLNRPAEFNVVTDQRIATEFIDKAIYEIKRASIDDGKNPEWHMPIDARIDRPGRLGKAAELIEAARRDLHYEEDDYAALGWRARALHHVDDALAMTRRAMADKNWDRERGR